MMRKVLALILGCAAVALLSIVLDPVAGAVVGIFTKAQGPLFTVCASNLASLFLASVGGGILATAIARHRAPANILAVLSLAGGIAYALSQARPGGPSWYPVALPVAGALGAFLGGWIREV